jgi:hypothetical protein
MKFPEAMTSFLVSMNNASALHFLEMTSIHFYEEILSKNGFPNSLPSRKNSKPKGGSLIF